MRRAAIIAGLVLAAVGVVVAIAGDHPTSTALIVVGLLIAVWAEASGR